MFNFFRNNKIRIKVTDKVWLSKKAKWKACAKMANANSQCIFVAWFTETMEELSNIFLEYGIKSRLVLADELNATINAGLYIFIEHHPLIRVEQEAFHKLQRQDIPVLSSLDEPLFQLFGAGRLISVVRNLGMEEDEIVGHAMITNAIQRAQTKIQKQVFTEQKTSSQMEWFVKNIK